MELDGMIDEIFTRSDQQHRALIPSMKAPPNVFVISAKNIGNTFPRRVEYLEVLRQTSIIKLILNTGFSFFKPNDGFLNKGLFWF